MASDRRAIGFLEVQGYSVALAAMDKACKAADIDIRGIDSNNPDPGAKLAIPVMVQVKFAGDVSGVRVALEAARAEALRHVPEEAVLVHSIAMEADGLAPLIGIGKVALPAGPAKRRYARSDGSYEAVGLIETLHFATAVQLADLMCKTAYVDYLHSERYLGGRLVTVAVGGSTANVLEAVEAVRRFAGTAENGPLKAAIAVTNPHPEIMKFICRPAARRKPGGRRGGRG
jgi:microcompartment protein CcmL/EutN